MANRLRVMIAAIMLWFSAWSAEPVDAATLITDANGILLGASGVMIGNMAYDLSFTDGTCVNVFGACSQDRFTFQTRATAEVAAYALLYQVFIDVDANRQFDTRPALTRGCGFPSECQVLIPYDNQLMYNNTQNSALVYLARNHFVESADGVTRSSIGSMSDLSLDFTTWAVFTRSTSSPTAPSLPEPASWIMMVGGFAILGAAMRRSGGLGPERVA
jgi:hypothetical protein